jgi:alpha-ketoglutarate-dependent taurine dioxygenase
VFDETGGQLMTMSVARVVQFSLRRAFMSGQIKAVPMQPNIGAEIEGVDLSKPLDEEIRGEIYQALLTYKVVFFRNQIISREQHLALGRAFGNLVPVPTTIVPGYPELLELYGDAKKKLYSDIWHTDQSYQSAPPLGAILRSITLPSRGGDTVFSNVVSAYEALDAKVQAQIEGLRAVHDYTTNLFRYQYTPEKEAAVRASNVPFEHPVVAVHADTGERMIFVNPHYTSHIVGLEKGESDRLLRILFEEVTKPDHQVRFTWRPNSIAFWDNRSTQHYAVADYKEPRRMERIAIEGDPIRGVKDVLIRHKLPTLAGTSVAA